MTLFFKKVFESPEGPYIVKRWVSIETERRRTSVTAPNGLNATLGQLNVLALAAEGMSDKEIARKLGIPVNTVQERFKEVRRQNPAISHNRTSLVVAAMQHENLLNEITRKGLQKMRFKRSERVR